MFLGHFALAFAAKPLVPRASLALLIIPRLRGLSRRDVR